MAEPIVIRGGRVIDPESGLDEVADLWVDQGVITRIAAPDDAGQLEDTRRIDARGHVVCPGFIDLHSHALNLPGMRLQSLDGVTTALDLEAGGADVGKLYEFWREHGLPINAGVSASWVLARDKAVGTTRSPTTPARPPIVASFDVLAASAASPAALSDHQLGAMSELLEHELGQGAVGIGVLLGYLPHTERREYLHLARLAASHGTLAATHTRSAADLGSPSAWDSMTEVVDAARETGGHLHVCHLNSTCGRRAADIVALIRDARADGVRVSAEAYPYERGSTSIGASFLSAEGLRAEDRRPSSLIYVPTGEHVADEHRLEELRRDDPGAIVLTLSYDLRRPAERDRFDVSVLAPQAAFASDAMPLVRRGGGYERDDAWPAADDSFAHPRSAGCYSRVFRWLVRERGALTLTDAIRRCTLLPAQILDDAAPAMRRKGRVQPGCDADLVVFDPEQIADRADYASTRPSVGFRAVLVGGIPVVEDGAAVTDAFPGRPVQGRGADAA